MVKRLLAGAVILAALALCYPTLASWGGGSCATVVAPVLSVPARLTPAWEWKSGRDTDQVHLYRGGRQVGTYRLDLGKYFPFDGNSWGEACDPPSPVPGWAVKTTSHCQCCNECECDTDPCPCKQTARPCKQGCKCVAVAKGDLPAKDAMKNFGLDLKGWREEPRQALPLFEGGVPDDAHKLRVTVIGLDEDRRKVLLDLESSPVKDLVVVNAYPPTHWAVQNLGFKTDGRPTVYVQAPDGRVLHRQDEYRGKDKLVEAIRKADPNYRPDRDPDLNAPPLKIDLESLKAWWPLALGAVVLLYIHLQAKKGA